MKLDLGLPAGDGFRRSGADERQREASFDSGTVLSGRNPASRDRAIEAGAKAFLQKPAEHGKHSRRYSISPGRKGPPNGVDLRLARRSSVCVKSCIYPGLNEASCYEGIKGAGSFNFVQ